MTSSRLNWAAAVFLALTLIPLSGCTYLYRRPFYKPAAKRGTRKVVYWPTPDQGVPLHFGHFPTCWRVWPEAWNYCPPNYHARVIESAPPPLEMPQPKIGSGASPLPPPPPLESTPIEKGPSDIPPTSGDPPRKTEGLPPAVNNSFLPDGQPMQGDPWGDQHVYPSILPQEQPFIQPQDHYDVFQTGAQFPFSQ